MKTKKKKILLVDDEREIREILGFHLRRGFDVITAANGKEGFEKIRDESPDLIITDLVMPEGSGFDFIGSVKNTGIPIIAISGRGAEYLQTAKEMGVAGVLEKPFSMTELQKVLRETLEVVKP